ncbi:MAG: host attachment protein [Noviherbaspirillum sp.]
MRTTWILAADSSRARIFEVHGLRDHLREIEDFANPAGRRGELDLTSDSRGRFYGRGGSSQANTGEPSVDPVEHETELFSKQVSEYLDKARNEHRFDTLCLIAYPKFLGMMRQNLSKEVQKLVKDEVPKDISGLDAREIEDYFRNKLH